jgi:FkbM family methyltransferase
MKTHDNENTMIKSLVKRIIRGLGFELHYFRPAESESARIKAMLEWHRVNLVFDVGANVGQFGLYLREAGYKGRIVSFEPLSCAREQLISVCKKDPLWEVAPRMALGSNDGEIDIHVAKNLVSSSLLEMHDTHLIVAPESRFVGIERVPLRKLDSVAQDYLHEDSVVFLKIDTQGYEEHVLQGSNVLIDRLVGFEIELSLVPLYKEQSLFKDMIDKILSMGFDIWSIIPGFTNPQSARMLQVDVVFFRR